jgi:holo-ACP synthase CitX
VSAPVPDRDGLAWAQRASLTARETRSEMIRGALDAPPDESWALLFLSTNVPGLNKNRPELQALVERSIAALETAWPAMQVRARGVDALGPYLLGLIPEGPEAVKRAVVRMEETLAGGRLLDLDVYSRDGTSVDRARLGLQPRACFACSQPARECILVRRHDLISLLEAVESILGRALEHGALRLPLA